MSTTPQPANRISVNIPRGLSAIVNHVVDKLKQRGIHPMLAEGLGEVANVIISKHPGIPKKEITIADMVEAITIGKGKD